MKAIKKIKSGLLSRQFSLAKFALKAGPEILFSGESELKDKLKQGLEKHLDQIVSELGIMKGSLMKAGQMLSLYSGGFLSPEAQKILKVLENQTNFLDWMAIRKQIPEAWQKELEINSTPLAAASLGQVHLATPRNGDETFAMKVQYDGVRKAIDNDLRSLRWLLRALGILPKELDLDDVFLEIREMLLQETDYRLEKMTLETYAKFLNGHPDYVIPRVIEKYSNEKIISTSFLKGVSPRSPEVKALPQEVRNRLGEEFLRLLFLEIFHWGYVQTDPHFGNYLIVDIDTHPRWGLLDFGAIKEPPTEFLRTYKQLVIACATLDRDRYFESLNTMGYLSSKKSSNDELLWEYASHFAGPFQGTYDWGASDLPDKVFKYFPRLIREISVGNPPRHAIFIDRKIGGVFFMLKELEVKIDGKKILEEFTSSHSGRI